MAVELLKRQKHFNSLLPRLVEAYSLAASDEPAELAVIETHTLSPLFGQLCDDFSLMLPASEIVQADSHDALVRVTARCSQVLEQRRKEIQEFVNALGLHVLSIQVRGELHADAMMSASMSARRELLEAVQEVFIPVEPVLTADLMPQPLPVVQRAVQNWLTTATQGMASQFVLALHRLVERDVVGFIEWTDERICKLHYFRHTIIQGRTTTEKSSTVRRVRPNTLTIEETERQRTRTRHTVERHDHHVMNAEARTLDQTQFPIPEKYSDLITRMPEWLRPHVRVLEGELFLERVAERLIREDQWESQHTVRQTIKIDPAIVLGHYVLAGWGQAEVERETHRRLREQTAEARPVEKPNIEAIRESQQFQTISNATAAASVAMMLFSRLQPRLMLPMSLMLSVVAVVTLWHSLQVSARGSQVGVNLIDCACRAIALACGLLAGQSALFGILYGSWSMFGLAIPLALVAIIIRGLVTTRETP